MKTLRFRIAANSYQCLPYTLKSFFYVWVRSDDALSFLFFATSAANVALTKLYNGFSLACQLTFRRF